MKFRVITAEEAVKEVMNKKIVYINGQRVDGIQLLPNGDYEVYTEYNIYFVDKSVIFKVRVDHD